MKANKMGGIELEVFYGILCNIYNIIISLIKIIPVLILLARVNINKPS